MLLASPDLRETRARSRLIRQTEEEMAELGIERWHRGNLAVDLAVRACKAAADREGSIFVPPEAES